MDNVDGFNDFHRTRTYEERDNNCENENMTVGFRRFFYYREVITYG